MHLSFNHYNYTNLFVQSNASYDYVCLEKLLPTTIALITHLNVIAIHLKRNIFKYFMSKKIYNFANQILNYV